MGRSRSGKKIAISPATKLSLVALKTFPVSVKLSPNATTCENPSPAAGVVDASAVSTISTPIVAFFIRSLRDKVDSSRVLHQVFRLAHLKPCVRFGQRTRRCPTKWIA